MPEDRKSYEIEGGTEDYLRLVSEMEERWWNQLGTDKTWVERTIRAFDEDYQNVTLVG